MTNIIQIIEDLLQNPVFIIPMMVAMITQGIKGLIRSIQERKFLWRAFFEWGGMPSSHSALVVSLSLIIGIKEGFNSTIYILSMFFAGIVIADAIGVRLATEEQAKVINKIIQKEIKNPELKEIYLKESIGHTPIEAITGGIIGLILTHFIYYGFFVK
ncbi:MULTISPECIES: divergent PAP2 family protein [Dictyoglomus]|uniref:Acid phosphatase/vanadium-dependent haloperoxidase related n=1 Tax=Dictyoglomus turgidum (strain DSM 6724 / Z-1310) TaxID=515635 RepID=B8E2Q0_DICTD|nr:MULTISPECIES: divergent PAP2 family protein [Dictyoglomus]ACK42894.1 acid phosphatase/vanadium-dependent haloperoxidase related [Dictyoglomus turgidum DSM 6724]HBU30956.1 divergent PAP2 family protein [Dictyoglomus sp.]